VLVDGSGEVVTLWKLARVTRQAAQLSSATRNPTRYARNRVISKGLGLAGFWKAFGRIWR
jgi:hypothetical protein